MLIKIKRWINDTVLYSGEFESIKDCIVSAVKEDADLSGANLSCANLSGANLSGANLSGANLYGADIDSKYCYISISPIGSESGRLWTMKNNDGVLIYNRGCFSGTRQEFIDAVKKKHGGTIQEKIYMSAVELIDIRFSEIEKGDG